MQKDKFLTTQGQFHASFYSKILPQILNRFLLLLLFYASYHHAGAVKIQVNTFSAKNLKSTWVILMKRITHSRFEL